MYIFMCMYEYSFKTELQITKFTDVFRTQDKVKQDSTLEIQISSVRIPYNWLLTIILSVLVNAVPITHVMYFRHIWLGFHC